MIVGVHNPEAEPLGICLPRDPVFIQISHDPHAMSPSRPISSPDEILDTVWPLPPDLREAYLPQACGNNATLEAKARALPDKTAAELSEESDAKKPKSP